MAAVSLSLADRPRLPAVRPDPRPLRARKGNWNDAVHFNALAPIAAAMLLSLVWRRPWVARLWTAGFASFAVYGVVATGRVRPPRHVRNSAVRILTNTPNVLSSPFCKKQFAFVIVFWYSDIALELK